VLKRCSSCAVEKPLDDFHKQSNGPFGRRSACAVCINTHAVRRNKRDPQARRSVWLKHRYGITQAQYLQRLDAQGGVCAICSEACATGRNLAVDHDHATGVIRGLLCQACNTAIGKLRDSPSLIHKAAAYLLKSHVNNL
jgi:Recombination endonuclease VII